MYMHVWLEGRACGLGRTPQEDSKRRSPGASAAGAAEEPGTSIGKVSEVPEPLGLSAKSCHSKGSAVNQLGHSGPSRDLQEWASAGGEGSVCQARRKALGRLEVHGFWLKEWQVGPCAMVACKDQLTVTTITATEQSCYLQEHVKTGTEGGEKG